VKEITAKEAARISGKSVYWLRNHECAWCGQSALNALRYGCGAIYEKCNPLERKPFNIKPLKDTR